MSFDRLVLRKGLRVVGCLLLCALFPGASFAAVQQPGYPVPAIIGPTNPQSVSPGGGDFTLHVYGANFITGSVVNWNKQPRVTTYVSGHELDAQILAADIANNTAGMVTVTTTSPNGPIPSSTWFQVEVHVPTTGFTLIGQDPPRGQPFVGALMVADVNGDGKLDLADGGSWSHFGQIQTVINQGDGTFALGPLAAGNYFGQGPNAMGDFNGDGIPDLLYMRGNIKSPLPLKFGIDFGKGDGNFTPGPSFGSFGPANTTLPLNSAALGDFNRDGTLDVAAVGNTRTGVMIYLNNGDGTFRPNGYAIVGQAPQYMISGDFNGDGILDLATVAYDASFTFLQLGLLLGNGDGTFQRVRYLANDISDTSFHAIVASDFNGDGKLDMVYNDGSQLVLLIGIGDGTFQKPVYISPSINFGDIVAGDFNSDGKTDLLVYAGYAQHTGGHGFYGKVALLMGNGDGTFAPPMVQNVPNIPNGPSIIGDLNNDGLLDLAFGGIFVFLQQ